MMNRLPLILLFITLGACAPENDPTSQYDTAKYVALKEQALDKQYYLPNNAINLQVAMTPKWQKAASNEITVTFYSNIEGLVEPQVFVSVGKNSQLPDWLNFNSVERTPQKLVYVLSGNPSERKSEDLQVKEYEIEFSVNYNQEKSSKGAKELVSFYPSQMKRILRVTID